MQQALTTIFILLCFNEKLELYKIVSYVIIWFYTVSIKAMTYCFALREIIQYLNEKKNIFEHSF